MGVPSVPSGLFDVAGVLPDAGGSQEISDAVAERLLRSLGAMEADYERTLAAERRPPADNPLSTLPSDLNAALGVTLQEEPGGGGEASSDGESSRGDEEADPANNAYMTIGSDCGAGSQLGSDEDEDDEEGMHVEAPDGVQQAQPPVAPLARGGGDGAAAEVGGNSWSQPGESSSGWPQPPSEDDFQDFAAGGALENFADFGAANPALPPPLSGVSSLQATMLTDHEVDLIKETMKQVAPTPPAWAQRLHDSEFQMMVRKALRGT